MNASIEKKNYRRPSFHNFNLLFVIYCRVPYLVKKQTQLSFPFILGSKEAFVNRNTTPYRITSPKKGSTL